MISFSSLTKKRGVMAAGIFSVALGSVLLLCGAGSVPIENLLPQGTMQGDLNAGGHNLTNAGTVSATNVVVSGSLTAPSSFTLSFAQITSPPTTLSGYGITAVPWSDVTGAAAFITLSGAPVQSVAGRTGAITLSASDISGLPASLPPNGSAGGDLAGTYPNPTVTNGAHLQGTALTAPAGSVYVAFGDSITAGVPYITYTGYQQSGGPTGGYSYVQQLSASAYFHNIPCYDLGIIGALSSDEATRITTNYGTEYLNGAVVGTVGGVNVSLATLYSYVTGNGKFYVSELYGANDGPAGVSDATYISNVTSLYSTAHGYGSNVEVIAVTPYQITGSHSGEGPHSVEIDGYNKDLWGLPSTIGSRAATWDTLADVGGMLHQQASLYVGTYLQSDAIHGTTTLYQTIANEIIRAIIAGPAHNQDLLPTYFLYSYSTGQPITSTFYGRLCNPTTGTAIVDASGPYLNDYYNRLVLDISGENLYCTSPSTVQFNWSSQYYDKVLSSYLAVDTVGYGLEVKEGSNAKQGTATLVAGTVTVSDSAVTANSRIFLTTQAPGGTVGTPYVSARSAGTSFTITSTSSSDTSTVGYEIFEAAP